MIHRFIQLQRLLQAVLLAGLCPLALPAQTGKPSPFAWPEISSTQRPWTYWWWMASAVDRKNISNELTRYREAGLGGVHIIPIYGAKGWESNYIAYLSPKWMDMLRFTVTEANRLGLGVDVTTGTGWCFGGPEVTDDEANASLVWRGYEVAAGGKPDDKFDAKRIQALMAFGPDGKRVELTSKILPDGSLDWQAEGGTWRVYAVSQRPSGQKVKRPAPGGEGHMLNLAYPKAMTDYLRWFGEPFARYKGPKPRAQYHDSYEYRCDWSPVLLAEFEKRRGYRLQDHLNVFLTGEPADQAARLKCDYRETFSDILADTTLPMWADWSRRNGFLTRNEAHGSPGNWLDLYAVADIPETEMFYKDRNKLISKFASSAAHVTGKRLTSCETGTWLQEHFTETLADMKYLQDDLFLSGVNHIFYHGTCYSPDEAGWPGWLFYASFEMNPRNSIWHDVPALNAYAARCQSILQSGTPDNDILLYWPIHDFWSDPSGTIRNLTVHARDWFEAQPIGRTAANLWERGYAFDYVSDRQLARAKADKGTIRVAGGSYRAVVVPPCARMPVETLGKLLALAESGATVIFEQQLPSDVPGLGKLDVKRAEFKRLLARVTGAPTETTLGKGRVLIGKVGPALGQAGIARESLFDQAELMCVRRAFDGGHHYFIANRSAAQPVTGWIPLARPARSVVMLDALSGRTGVGAIRQNSKGAAEVFLQLAPGESIMLRCFDERKVDGPKWDWWAAKSEPVAVSGTWQVKFLSGGPELPSPVEMPELRSWTTSGDEKAESFAGTALYRITFDAPDPANAAWELSLGKVCQSARVRLNGKELGTLIAPPFRVVAQNLKPKGNLLEVEVTNVSANAIRYYDRHRLKWKTFHDINFVNLNYRPFDASDWPLSDSGLLGPVTLTAVARATRIEEIK